MRRVIRHFFTTLVALSLALALCGLVLASWVSSLSHRHGVATTGWRHYALVADSGMLEARYGVRTDAFFGAADPEIREVAFQPGDSRPKIRWQAAEPPATFSSMRWVQSASLFSGGELPIPARRADRTVTIAYHPFGERITVYAVPHWLVGAALAWPAGLWLIRAWHRRRSTQRGMTGLCRLCGYDLRASRERCPECGTAVTPAA